MPFNLSCQYPIFSIILLYNKEAVSRTLCSLSASASRVAATGADTALYNFEIVFLKNVFIFYYTFYTLRYISAILNFQTTTLRSVNSFDAKNNENVVIKMMKNDDSVIEAIP